MWGDLCWLENDNFTTKITNNGAKSCTNRFGCQIGFHTMAVVQGLIGIHENHSGQNDSYNGSDCARIVQIFLAPKWHHYLLQNLYQPGPNNCRRHYVTRYCSTSHINPPPPSATAAETMSASEASDHDDLTQYAPGHMPMPDFEALARDIQNRVSRRVGAAMTETRTCGNFSRRACSSSKEYGSCLTGTPSSQRVVAQSTCFGP